VQQLAQGQCRRGHHVNVAAVIEPEDGSTHPFVAALRAATVPVDVLCVPPRRYLRERRLVAELCQRLKPAIAHTHGYRPDVLHAPVARRLGIATVATVHGFTGGGWKNRLYEYLNRRALRDADAVVAVSRVQVAQLGAAGISAQRLFQVPNAWTPGAAPLTRGAARAALGIREEGFVIGWVGRLTPEKGADVLLEALARVRIPEWTAILLGDGPEGDQLKARAAALGIAERVRWTGVVPDAQRFYGAFDVFALSSRTEGVPMVLFEAMEAEIPVVATRVGGVPEVIGASEGWLVGSEDSGALAAAIEEVAREPAQARERAHAARHVLRTRFGADAWLAAYDAVYRRVLARFGSS
jgi:glycosyltransferase involved in cell wall biosynthesis